MLLTITLILVVSFFSCVAIYNRHIIIKRFKVDVESLTEQFRYEIEKSTNESVKKMEHQLSQLEYMLEEADVKMLALEQKLADAEAKLAEPVQVEVVDNNQVITTTVMPKPEPVVSLNILLDTLDRRQQVMILYNQGYSVIEIAKAISIGKGEVMLLLELNKS